MRLSEYIPLRFRGKTLDGYVPKTERQHRALVAVAKLAGGTYRSVVLVGPPGVGKTHLAAGAVVARGQQAKATAAGLADGSIRDPMPMPDGSYLWANVADLLAGLRSEIGAPRDDQPSHELARALRTERGLVVLDDLGREKASDWTGELVYAVVNHRYEHRLPTLVTSNLTLEELGASAYWPAVSRLAEDGELVVVDGKDQRFAEGAK